MHYNGLTAALLQADHSAIMRQLWHYPWARLHYYGQNCGTTAADRSSATWANGSIITDRRRHHYIVSPPQ